MELNERVEKLESKVRKEIEKLSVEERLLFAIFGDCTTIELTEEEKMLHILYEHEITNAKDLSEYIISPLKNGIETIACLNHMDISKKMGIKHLLDDIEYKELYKEVIGKNFMDLINVKKINKRIKKYIKKHKDTYEE